jgi:hypothetical protein
MATVLQLHEADIVFYRLIQFVEFQPRLIIALQKQFPQYENIDWDDWEYMLALPKAGSLFVVNENWTFQRHGLGVCFTGQSSGKVIDVHTFLNKYPKAFDAWRLQQYFESLDMITVRCGVSIYNISEENEIEKYLKDLLSRHLINIVSPIPLLYRLNEEM